MWLLQIVFTNNEKLNAVHTSNTSFEIVYVYRNVNISLNVIKCSQTTSKKGSNYSLINILPSLQCVNSSEVIIES